MATKHEITRRGFLGTVGAGITVSKLAPLAGQAQDASSSRSTGTVEKDVVYAKGGQTDLHCDIYKPSTASEKRMAIIHFHGGGFGSGSKDNLADRITPLTARGYVSIAAQYRLSGVAKWPAQMEDVKASIRWTRANAGKLGIDPKRIAVAGYSAGGHLALFAASTANRSEFEGDGGNRGVGTEVAACLAFYAVTGPAWNGWKRAFPLPADSSDEAFHAAEPANYIKSFPPTVLFHGLTDVTVPPESSQQFLQLLRDAVVPAELHTFAGVPHEFVQHPEFALATAQITDLFFDRYVINPRTYPPFGAGRGGARGGRE
jgi:acetyl esterase/lipase